MALCVLGDDRTGKTTFQKKIIKLLAYDNRDIRLDCNLLFDVKHSHLIRKLRNFSIANRSYHEKTTEYGSVEDYFNNYFREADMCFISSHVTHGGAVYVDDIKQMITEGQRRFYNVCGLFFENSIAKARQANRDISVLHWDERWVVANPQTEEQEQQDSQLLRAAEELVQMLIERTRGW